MEPENKKPLPDSTLRRVAGGEDEERHSYPVYETVTIRLPGYVPEEKWKCSDGKQHNWDEVNCTTSIIQCRKCALFTFFSAWYEVTVDGHFFDPYDPYDFS